MYVQCYAIAIDQWHRNNSMYNNHIQCITFALLHWLGLRVRDRFRFRVRLGTTGTLCMQLSSNSVVVKEPV